MLFTIISVLLSAMVGYGVQMYEFRGRKVIIIMIMSTMMIPLETLMIPLYNEVSKMHLLNTYMGVFCHLLFSIYNILFYAVCTFFICMNIWMQQGSMAWRNRIFTKIMGPLMKPAFASMIILQATTAWNDFLWPLIVMSKNDRFTLSVGLQTYLSPYGNNYNLLFAGAVLSVIPVMILFFLCQNLFMEGMIAGGIKG